MSKHSAPLVAHLDAALEHGQAFGVLARRVTNDHLKKLSLVAKDLDEYSRETVLMFYKDATSAGFSIPLAAKRATS